MISARKSVGLKLVSDEQVATIGEFMSAETTMTTPPTTTTTTPSPPPTTAAESAGRNSHRNSLKQLKKTWKTKECSVRLARHQELWKGFCPIYS